MPDSRDALDRRGDARARPPRQGLSEALRAAAHAHFTAAQAHDAAAKALLEAAEAVEDRSAPAWLSTREVAEHLRVSSSAVRQWRRRGVLEPDGGTPGQALYSRALVEAFALARGDGGPVR